jgi:hypothetical protein
VAGLGRGRAVSERIASTNNMKMLGIAMHNANDTYGRFPPSVGPYGLAQQNDTLFFHVLPYMEQDNIFRARQMNAVVKYYRGPGDPSLKDGQPLTSYATNYAVFGPQGIKIAQFVNGTSNTIAMVERYAVTSGQAHNWSDTNPQATYITGKNSGFEFDVPPEKATQDAAHCFGGGVLPVLLADGSTRQMAKREEAAFKWACDPASNFPPPGDW